MKNYLATAAGLAWLAISPTAALAWCEADCVGLCRATAGKGYQGSAATCIQQYQCAQYAGKPCEPARRAARAKALNAGGGVPSTFAGCMERGVKAGWGSAETSQYCRRQGYR